MRSYRKDAIGRDAKLGRKEKEGMKEEEISAAMYEVDWTNQGLMMSHPKQLPRYCIKCGKWKIRKELAEKNTERGEKTTL